MFLSTCDPEEQVLAKCASTLESETQKSTMQKNLVEVLISFYFFIFDMQLKEYIDDTEDLINIKLVRNCSKPRNFPFPFPFPKISYLYCEQGNVQNQLIQFELLLTAATFVATIFAAVTGVFGMNFTATIFDYPSAFNWVLVITGLICGFLYFTFLLYFKHKKVFPS